jgi:hypothetical protein
VTTKYQDKFDSFLAANPHVYPLFKRFAHELWQAGRSRMSSRQIVGRIRWEADINTTGDTFKINENFTSLFARKMIAEEPQFADAFELRRLRA